MNIIDLIANAHGGRGFESIGRQFGLDETQTRSAVEALAPVVAAGLRRNTQSNDGLADLIGALVQGNHGRYVEDPSAVQFDRVADDGNAILGHIFGSRDVSRGVAQQAAGLSGIGGSILKKMLPVIASMVIGALAKQMFGGGRGAAQPRQADAGGGLGDILGDILGGSARQQPSPGQQTPPGGLEDILKDILGGGATGQAQPGGQGMPPGGLNDILKDIFGGGPASAGRQPRPQSDEVARRTRGRLDDVLGGGSRGGSAADDLLNSVEQAIRRGS